MPVTGSGGSQEPLVAPILSGVTISGVALLYGMLTANVGSCIGYPTPTVTFQWYSGGGYIPGATGTNYVVQPADQGTNVSVVVTAINEAGSASLEAAVGIPAPTPPAPTGGGGGGAGGTSPPPPSAPGGGSTVSIVGQTGLESFDLTALFTTGGPTTPIDPGGGIGGAGDGWDYLRNAVESVFTDSQYAFDEITASTLEDGTLVAVTEIGAGAALDIEALPAVAFAAALLAGEYVFGWAVKKIGELVPNPSLFGWHPLGFIPDSLKSLGKGLEHDASYWGDRIAAVFITPVRQLVGLFQRIINSVSGAHNKASHIVNHNIPGVLGQAQTYADNAAQHEVALIDQAMATARDNIATITTEGQARTMLDDSRRIGGIVWDVTGLAAAAVVATDEYAKRLFDTGSAYTDSQVAQAKVAATKALTDFQGTLLSRLTTDEQAIINLDQSLTSTVSPAVAAAIQSAVSAGQSQTTGQIGALQAQITTLQGQVDTLTSRVATDEATIAKAKADIVNITAAETIDVTALEEAQATITSAQTDIAIANQQIGDLNTTITTIGDQLNQVQQLQQATTTALAPVEPPNGLGLATILATLTATVAAIRTKVDTCTVDNCDTTNPNNIRNVLRGLLGLFTAAAEIGFIAEAIHNPQGTADALAPFLDTIDTTGVDTLNALLSL